MGQYVSFDPDDHGRNLQLYELQTREVNGVCEFFFAPVEDVIWEDVAATPWYYYVKI